MLTACPQLAQVSSAAKAAGAESHMLVADSQSNIARVEVRANAKPVKMVRLMVFLFRLNPVWMQQLTAAAGQV
jgi:hypothetical protein